MINYVKTHTSISTGSLPFRYLRVPVFRGAPKVEHLSPIVDSIINIFSRWRGQTLSLAGHRCLINSVIASSLVHTMMVYRWPKTLLHHMETAIRSYLWTGDASKKGFSNVNWKWCSAPLSEGGFDIRSLRIANASFCCKLAWEFLTTTDRQAMFIRNRYFDKRGQASNRRCVSSIRPGLHDHIGTINAKTRWLIGEHSNINFWSDNWLACHLCDKLQILPNISSQLHCSVGDYFFDGLWHFTTHFYTRHPEIILDIVRTPIHTSNHRV